MANETPKLTFKYLGNSDWPRDKENGTLYFKLISNDNNNIYGNTNSFEMAIDLDNDRYFITPKLADVNDSINGLLSSDDKGKIDSLSIEKLITTDNIKNEIRNFITINDVKNLFNTEDKNVVFTITKNDESSITSEGTLKIDTENNNKIKLNFSVPYNDIKGEHGDKGDTGESPKISENVNLSYGNVPESSASFEKDESTGEYKLNLNFPNLEGKSGANGKSCSINEISVTMTDDDTASGEAILFRSSDSENSYNINLRIPKGKRGPRGYPGAPGATGGIESLNIERNGGGNTVQDIEYIKDNGNKFTLSTHNSPILSSTMSSKQYSILYKNKNGNNDLTYTTLEPPEDSTDVMILYYNNNKENDSSKLGYASKDDLGIPKIELKQNNENDYYYIELHNVVF